MAPALPLHFPAAQADTITPEILDALIIAAHDVRLGTATRGQAELLLICAGPLLEELRDRRARADQSLDLVPDVTNVVPLPGTGERA